MDDELTEFPTRRVRLQECQICGRQFNADALSKHQAICRKVSNKKRKVFDAGKQRAKDSDVPYKATKKTAQIYTGEAPARDDKSKSKSKPTWREKHKQLIQSIREARSVTRAIKEGGPIPVFQPSDVPSDYVCCPYCHRNFNEHVAKRHMPFCQTQHQRKQTQSSKPEQQLNRGRTLPPQNSSQYKQQQQQQQQQQYQQSPSSDMYSGPHDVYNNGYKHSNSAPMLMRRNPAESQQPLPPPRKTTGDGWSFRKLFGMNPREEPAHSANYYTPDDEDEYEPPARRPMQQPVLMRTGRTQENTSINVRARQRIDDTSPLARRMPPKQPAPPSYGQQNDDSGQYARRMPPKHPGPPSYGQQNDDSSQYVRRMPPKQSGPPSYGQQNDDTNQYVRRMPPKQPGPHSYGQQNDDSSQYVRRMPPKQPGPPSNGQPRNQRGGNDQYNSMRPTAVGRPPPPTGIRCGECGGMFNNASARYCPQCGSRR